MTELAPIFEDQGLVLKSAKLYEKATANTTLEIKFNVKAGREGAVRSLLKLLNASAARLKSSTSQKQ